MNSAAAAPRAQLDDIEKSIAALESQKGRLLEDLGSLKYPVLTLPNEITVEIFLHFVSVMRQENHRPQPYHAVLKLASVCQSWRAVTLSTCALWNDGVKVDCHSIRDAGQLLEVCLARAGSLPLDLDIRLPDDEISRDTISSTLGLYGSQWRHVHLSSPDIVSNWILDLNYHFPSSLPVLESFTLSDIQTGSSLRHAPQLRELSLRNSSWAIQLGLPLNKLTKLDLIRFDITPLLAVLAYTPNLECLQLAYGYATEDTQVVPLSVLLPHLHTFVCEQDPSTMVLQYLTLPALERIELVYYLSDAGVRAILSCVARSCSTIRTLNINHLAFNDAYDCLRSLPTIRHLCLSQLSWSNDQQDSFFAAMVSGGCLPVLESLTCEECWPQIRADKLIAVVSARWLGVEGTTKLNSVSLDFDEDSNPEFANAFDQLYELGRQGLKLAIT
ncbi:hypothetical protein GGX14DRAFT_648112 [Mycena pura]|uniref:F-box domain-containing protein n=1 Tax=Mycena pura TaxID=153505 RepID=A0AAD6V6J4_9AGAR|nr:hypothetical protein GGX14DRAFT_648112 [Mycena pura]